MRVFAAWIEHALDVTMKRRLQHPDPGVHQKILPFSGLDQDFDGRLPFLKVLLLGFRQLHDVAGGVFKRDELRPRESEIGSSHSRDQFFSRVGFD
jgi:hypothetical protein